MDRIEAFAATYQHSIPIVALLLALGSLLISVRGARANNTKMHAQAYIGVLFQQVEEGYRKHRYFMISVTNRGTFPLSIADDMLFIGLFGSKKWTAIIPNDESTGASFIPHSGYPVEITPRRSERFVICEGHGFVGLCCQLLHGNRLERWFNSHRLYIEIKAVDGTVCRAQIDRSLWRYLRAAAAEYRLPTKSFGSKASAVIMT